MDRVLQIVLLGSFQLYYDNKAVTTFESPRLQSLLAYLVLHRDAPQPRQQIAYHFWPVSSESQARTNLRKLFLQLRRALPDADRFLIVNNQTIQWRDDAPYALDVGEAQHLLKVLEDNPLDRDALTHLFDLYSGELLPSCYDDWIVPLRRQLHQGVMAALDRLVTLLENQRAFEEGIRYARRLLSLDPLDEKGYQRLMRLHVSDDNRAGALKVYQECVETLERELGVDPARETQAIYEQLLQARDAPTIEKPKPMALPDISPLVGRRAEWQTLQEAWQRAGRGNSNIVVISGEAGIGKTQLAEELFIWANQQGIAAARTRSYQAQGALTYAPITELMRANTIYNKLVRLSDLRLAQVARLLPELLDERPDLPHPQPMMEGWQRQQFFDALVHAILRDGQPLLLLFDDLQWFNDDTLEWLHYLLRSADQSMLLIVGTIRTGESNNAHPLYTLLNNLRREDLLHEIALAPLNSAEVAELVKGIAQAPLDREQTAQLYSDTEGNPLFVVEMVRARSSFACIKEKNGANTDRTTPDSTQALHLPPKVHAVIQSRLTQLSTHTQDLIRLAAVIGRSFSYNLLVAVSQHDEETVVGSLDELWERQIIREQGADGYDFSHDCIRDVAYGGISGTQRRLLHRRVAEALQSTSGSTQVGQVAATLAYHYVEGGEKEKAVDYLIQAGDTARHLHANQEALRHYQQAAALVSKASSNQLLKQSSGHVCLDDILNRQAQIHLDLFQGQEAASLFEKLVNHARKDSDREKELSALLGLGQALFIIAFDDPIPDAIARSWNIFGAASELARELNDKPRLVRALTGTRWFCIFSYDYLAQSGINAKEALALSKTLGDDQLIRDAVLGLFHFENPTEWVHQVEAMICPLEANRDLAKLNELYYYLMLIHNIQGNFQRVLECCEAGIHLAQEIGAPPVQYPSLKSKALLHLGRYAEAWAVLQEELADDAYPFGQAFQNYGRAIYYLDILAVDQAIVLFERVDKQARQLYRPWLSGQALVMLAKAHCLMPKLDIAVLERIDQELYTIAKEDVILWSMMIGMPGTARAEIAFVKGEYITALTKVDAAIAAAQETGRQPDHVISIELKMRILLKQGQAREAVHLADSALQIAEQNGYLPMLRRLWATKAKVLEQLGAQEQAIDAAQAAICVIQKLAESIDHTELRNNFLAHSLIVSIKEIADKLVG
ncbi:AAA family ATPase [Chloroflexi bacterium TSY]|nr:AAA family ATPase [Chloroflexi bacterium TSY]